jgi:hypothetical protein
MIPILSIFGHILYASKSPPPYPIGHITTLQPLAIPTNIAMQSVATATHIVILLQGHLLEGGEGGQTRGVRDGSGNCDGRIYGKMDGWWETEMTPSIGDTGLH